MTSRRAAQPASSGTIRPTRLRRLAGLIGPPSWLGKLWAAPVSLFGLLVGLPSLAFGSRLRCEHNALVFHRFPLGPGGAIVFGNVVLNTATDMERRVPTYAARAAMRAGTPMHALDTVRLADHERAHTLQYEALGVFFLPLYLFGGGVSARNRFERAADRYASTGRGWWPYGAREG